MTEKNIFKLSLFLLMLFVIGAAVFMFANKNSQTTKTSDQQQIVQEQVAPISLPADSIPEMSKKEFKGNDLKLVRVLAENEIYTRYSITYKSEGLTISGIMNVPKGKGPFPVLILNHGFIEPQNYTNGQGLKREQDFFARNGYVVLHSDYRNYGLSDYDPNNDVRPRSGFVEDVLNAVSAVKNSNFEFLDKENIGMLGHSMGGGITLNVMVTKPETAKAYVLLAPINADYKKNFDRWVVSDFPEAAQQFYNQYGTYEQNPQVWESFSAKNYFSKISAPVMLHQGVLDEDVAVEWSRELAKNLKDAEKEIIYYEYPNEKHTFINAQDLVMQRTLEFFNRNLKESKN